MSSDLKIQIPKGWQRVGNTGGPLTYKREGPSDTSLQFSVAHHKPGPVQNVSEEKLISICDGLTRNIRGRRDVSSRSGKCAFGIFGTVAAKGDSPAHVQAWIVSNHQDLILVTHVCAEEPTPQEIAEVEQVALTASCG